MMWEKNVKMRNSSLSRNRSLSSARARLVESHAAGCRIRAFPFFVTTNGKRWCLLLYSVCLILFIFFFSFERATTLYCCSRCGWWCLDEVEEFDAVSFARFNAICLMFCTAPSTPPFWSPFCTSCQSDFILDKFSFAFCWIERERDAKRLFWW